MRRRDGSHLLPALGAARRAGRLLTRIGWRRAVALAGLVLGASIPCIAVAQTPLYSFTGGADGGEPIGGVVADASGTLYGETYVGGTAACTSTRLPPKNGCGTLYRFNAAAGLKVLVTFDGSNGAHGVNTPTLAGSTLYGTTYYGGASDAGVVFSVHTDGTGFTLLHQFSGADGKNPAGILRIGRGNVLYGLTAAGGSDNYGVLFSIKPDGTYSVLHDFASGSDGADPNVLLIGSTGTLVGSTILGGEEVPIDRHGCGIDFEYVPDTSTYSVLLAFNGSNGCGCAVGSIGPGPTVYGNDGPAPYSLAKKTGLVQIGQFCFYCLGTVASGPLRAPDGTLFGVNGVGTNAEDGVLYSAVNGVTTGLGSFGGSSGYDPLAQPILTPAGALIGTASLGALCSECGTIWEYVP